MHKVIIGHNGDPGARGYVTAYDAETGQQRWRFYTVPGDPKKGFERGSELYRSAWCSFCHGPQLENTGSFSPDLRESVLAMNWKAFRSVLRDGVLAPAGMPKYDDLSDDDQHAIFVYIRQRAREAVHSSP